MKQERDYIAVGDYVHDIGDKSLALKVTELSKDYVVADFPNMDGTLSSVALHRASIEKLQQDRMYSREEVVEKLIKLGTACLSSNGDLIDAQPDILAKWIKENLK